MGKIHINIPARSIGRSAAADAWLDQFKTRERIMNDAAKVKPDIAAMTMEELAEYVVTLDGWEWDLANGALILAPSADVAFDLGISFRFSRTKNVRGVTDLADPATLGCLLSMVRARHGAYTYTLPTGRGWRVLIGNPDERFVSVVSAKEEMPTEAHALVAALAKEAS